MVSILGKEWISRTNLNPSNRSNSGYGVSTLPFPYQCQQFLHSNQFCPIGKIMPVLGNILCVSCDSNQYTGSQEAICKDCPDSNASQCDALTGDSTVCMPLYKLTSTPSPYACQPTIARLQKNVN